MDAPLGYCRNVTQRVKRLRKLYERRAPDGAFAMMSVPTRTLAEFARRYPAGPCAYPPPEERGRYWTALLTEYAGIDDDRIPCAYLSELDQGLYGCLVGGQARFMADPGVGWVSSMVHPILRDWAGFDALRFVANGEWAQRYDEILRVHTAAARGKYGISHFILIDGLTTGSMI